MLLNVNSALEALFIAVLVLCLRSCTHQRTLVRFLHTGFMYSCCSAWFRQYRAWMCTTIQQAVTPIQVLVLAEHLPENFIER
jgi:hypothetical protein